ncbi:MAG: hypothetical protein H6831_08395 [Planctomycetes bacterium]|nr:hypothetical protein [Planctomycetota bacterium]MCB9904412.1 hypothetical protein [Planctomycetota bacterium]
MSDSAHIGVEAFGAALAALDAELDWALLERLYCWDAGEGFFGAEEREALWDAGLQIAAGLSEGLAELPAGGPRRSVYVGAAVAELVPMLVESMVLGREVCAVNLPGAEADELNRAFEAVGVALRVDAELPDAEYDHLWVVSVLTDPEAFPALHDELYQRTGEGATGRGNLVAERMRAAELVDAWCTRLARRALVSTTDEELGFFEAEAARHGRRLEVPELGRLTAIVGDTLRHCGRR